MCTDDVIAEHKDKVAKKFVPYTTKRRKQYNTQWLNSRSDNSVGKEYVNPSALELDIYSLAHHLCKMWIFYEPRRVTLGNTLHFVEE